MYTSSTACRKSLLSYRKFFDERSAYLHYITTVPEEIIITEDLYFQLDDPTNLNVRLFSGLLVDHGLVQHVTGATHTRGLPLLTHVYNDTKGNGSGYHFEIHGPGL